MFQWAKDWVVDKVYGAAKTGIQAGGTMAGNAVGGVGNLIENSGRGVGQSASGVAGYVGGVGSYINSYGDGIINSTAAGGGSSSAEKKTAVKPTQAASKTAGNAQKGVSSATKSLPPVPASKALPAAQRTPPSKPPAKAAPAKAPPAKKPNTPQTATSKSNTLPKISASSADKTPDGKTRISAASRPNKPSGGGGAHSASSGVKKTTQNNAGPRPKISAGKEDRTPDGKIKISSASRPRPVKAA
ncbi:hypothetical protein M409DRAFT_70343 [Zasmidium cellare ATCC 36951]|uniref:Uncharacterized protein n=1 Tax=Zasmidium cellare ATCC 36951 TaxID=1080233 RepID=A0A6A6C0R2_ZASCE|nr:uncharacterized protein M409DRAFT_70343 [Zasmidium cellare ATCC 36951]KAF2160601.1 hypothetical protein M409DRAFT_70343 [Zasmidium cellare ATCC 36951]